MKMNMSNNAPEHSPLFSKKNCFLQTNILLDGSDESVLNTLQLKLVGEIHGNMAIWLFNSPPSEKARQR